MMIMVDVPNLENDLLISDHVIRIHRYRDPQEQYGDVLPLNSGVDVLSTKNLEVDAKNESENSIYVKYNPLLHGPVKKDILSTDFLKKFIAIAKCIQPVLETKGVQQLLKHIQDFTPRRQLLLMLQGVCLLHQGPWKLSFVCQQPM